MIKLVALSLILVAGPAFGAGSSAKEWACKNGSSQFMRDSGCSKSPSIQTEDEEFEELTYESRYYRYDTEPFQMSESRKRQLELSSRSETAETSEVVATDESPAEDTMEEGMPGILTEPTGSDKIIGPDGAQTEE